LNYEFRNICILNNNLHYVKQEQISQCLLDLIKKLKDYLSENNTKNVYEGILTPDGVLLNNQGNKLIADEMLAIGLNPSTANEDNLDPTSRNIQAIAQNNGCDGWWLVNLYPKRTSKPSNLPKKANQVIAKENIDFIKELIHNDNDISKILF